MSLLPISKETLIHGSNDGGKDVKQDDTSMAALLMEAGHRLNLRDHLAGILKDSAKLMSVPGALFSYCTLLSERESHREFLC